MGQVVLSALDKVRHAGSQGQVKEPDSHEEGNSKTKTQLADPHSTLLPVGPHQQLMAREFRIVLQSSQN